jgi:peptidoglycan/xylan/chitin deacetylase (PgdA/CDA1 family)
MIRRLGKLALASLVHHVRAEALVSPRRKLPFIVAYHRVVEDGRIAPTASHPAMLLTIRTLERHLEWLGRHFDFVSLDDVGDRMAGTVNGRRPVAAVTFDDGYQDVCDNAIPLLHRKGIPAAVFVVSDRVGTQELHLHDRLFLLISRLYRDRSAGARHLAAALRELEVDVECIARTIEHRLPGLAAGSLLAELDRATVLRLCSLLEPEDAPMSSRDHALAGWDTLRDIAARGFTIGSHGCTHALLANEDPRTVVHEVLASRLEIARRLGRPVWHIAYPAGSFDAVAVRVVAAAGYRCGYTICRHRDPRFPELTIPRHVFWENTCRTVGGSFSAALMSCHVHDVPGFRASCSGHRRPSRNGTAVPPATADVASASLARSEPGR